jgi:hypothetical protein
MDSRSELAGEVHRTGTATADRVGKGKVGEATVAVDSKTEDAGTRSVRRARRRCPAAVHCDCAGEPVRRPGAVRDR